MDIYEEIICMYISTKKYFNITANSAIVVDAHRTKLLLIIIVWNFCSLKFQMTRISNIYIAIF